MIKTTGSGYHLNKLFTYTQGLVACALLSEESFVYFVFFPLSIRPPVE
jgi:hypothetical protein